MFVKEFIGICLVLAQVIQASTVAASAPANCHIPIGSKEHYRYQWPLVYTLEGHLYASIREQEHEPYKVVIPHNEEVLFSCAPNYLKKFGRTEMLKVKCNGLNGKFSIIEEDAGKKAMGEMDITELTCDLRVIEEVLTPVEGCINSQWTGASFGYVDPLEQKSFILGEACFDMPKGVTRFTHVRMDGTNNVLRKEDKTYLTKRQHPDGRYKIELFRGLHFDEIYTRIRNQLKIKTAPALKFTNLIDENMLGSSQFQPVKKLGWNYFVTHDEMQVLGTLKSDIHKLSTTKSLNVYVGTHGVAEFKKQTEKMKLYLHETGSQSRFPMPELLWVVVKHDAKAAAFVVLNESDSNHLDTIEQESSSDLCNGDCSKYTWLSSNTQQGYYQKLLRCCSYEELKSKVEEVPQLQDIKDVLK